MMFKGAKKLVYNVPPKISLDSWKRRAVSLMDSLLNNWKVRRNWGIGNVSKSVAPQSHTSSPPNAHESHSFEAKSDFISKRNPYGLQSSNGAVFPIISGDAIFLPLTVA